MKRFLAFLLIAVLLTGAVGTAAFAAPGNSGKVHWKDQLIADWDEMMQEYLELKDELDEEGSLDAEDQARFDELEELLTGDSQLAKKFYLALRNRLNNKHYSSQAHVQNTVRVMNQFRERFENWDVLPFNSIISHKFNFLFDTPPMLAGGRTLVPVRALVEGLGADVEWIPYWDDDSLNFGDFAGFSTSDLVGMSETADQWLDDEMNANITANTKVSVVRISLDDIEIALFIDFPVAFVNDDGDIRWEALDTKPQVFDGRTYVPLRFISETFGLDVTWDNGTIIIDEDDDDDDDQDDPTVPSDYDRDSDEVTQDPFTASRYKLNVTFDPSDYDVVVYSVDGNDQNNSVDELVFYEEEGLLGFELNGYYVGLAIDIPAELDQSEYDPDYRTVDVVDVEWDGDDIETYAIVGDELYVYLPVTEDMEGSSPNLEVRWELALDKEIFDVKLQYLRFEDEPVEETLIERDDTEVTQYMLVGGENIDFEFDGEDKELLIFGRAGNEVPFIAEGDPLPDDEGYYVGLRIDAPEGFEQEDLEYVEFNTITLDDDKYDVSDNRLVYYLEIDPDDESDLLELTIKWGPQYVDETIEIRWFSLNLEEQLLVPERTGNSVRQDPQDTGGLGLDYEFDLEGNELEIETANGRSVEYYVASEGSLVDLDDEALPNGNWVGIEILRPTNYEGETIEELTIGSDTWNDLALDGAENDRLWLYFEAEEGFVDFNIEILWADNFEVETIVVDAVFFELAPEPTE